MVIKSPVKKELLLYRLTKCLDIINLKITNGKDPKVCLSL